MWYGIEEHRTSAEGEQEGGEADGANRSAIAAVEDQNLSEIRNYRRRRRRRRRKKEEEEEGRRRRRR
jgi:hypothetical protein